MNKKEIGELSRRWKPEKCIVSRIYGCYVSGSGKRIVADLDESLGRMSQDEAEFYLGFLKKVLSGAQGRNLIDIVFSTSQVVDSDEHRLLMDLKNTSLQNGDARRAFYEKVIDCLEMDEENYLILMASCDTKSRNELLKAAALSIWSNPTVTCVGGNAWVGNSRDKTEKLEA